MKWLIYGIGTDILEINRIKKSIESNHFIKRVFSEEEIEMFEQKNYSPQTIAANFCGKEAVSKSMGIGISGFSLKDISILRDEKGKPYIKLSGRALLIAKNNKLIFNISLSHTKEYAVAFVTAQQRNGE